MANPTPSKRNATYIKLQTAKQTSLAAFGITDAVRVRKHEMQVETTPVKRQGHDTPHDGGLKALPGITRTFGTIEVERMPSGAAGVAADWQQFPLWKACQHAGVEEVGGSYLRLFPQAGRIPFVHYDLCQIAKYTRDGRRRACYNASFAYETTKIEPGGEVVDVFTYEGVYVADADYDVDDVAGVYMVTVDTAADGTWTVRIADDLGTVQTDTITVSGDTTSEIASLLESAIDGFTGMGASASTDEVTVTSANKGRVLTITVTPADGGAVTVSTETAPVSFSERPTFQNDATPLVAFGGTITHQISSDDVLNCGAIELTTGAKLESKTVLASGTTGDAANGYGLARVPSIDEVMLSYEADVPKNSDWQYVDAMKAQTELSFLYEQSGEIYISAPQCTLMEAEEGERAGDNLLTAKLGLHSDGTGTNMWEQRVY